MPSVDEAVATGLADFAAAAASGVNALDRVQTIIFDLYDLHVLPADGYVFWVKRTPTVVATTQLTIQASVHISAVNIQDADANITQNRVIFTSLAEINDLNAVNPTTMWITTLTEAPFAGLKVAFSSQGGFYKQANLFHYVGQALVASNKTQIIDNPSQVPTALIVSNSLPIWLFLSNYVPSAPAYGFSNPFALYPSFLVPNDISPVVPYGAVDIQEGGTEAIQASPLIDDVQSHYQLVMDRVTVTLYGGTNKNALDFVDCVNQYSLDYGTLGIMNLPVIRDAKRPQAEFSILAMKKTVVFDVSYYQDNVNTIARQIIQKATATLYRTS